MTDAPEPRPGAPGPGQMALRALLLLVALVFGLIAGGPTGQVVIWAAGLLALYWLVRQLLPIVRRRR